MIYLFILLLYYITFLHKKISHLTIKNRHEKKSKFIKLISNKLTVMT